MIILGGTVFLGLALAMAAARCPLGRAIALAMNSQAEGPHGRTGMLD